MELLFCLLVIVLLFVFYAQKKEENKELERKLSKAKIDISVLQAANQSLSRQLFMGTNPSRYRYNPDVIDAVKYAMVKAHPDNGGKQDDFVKFKHIYEKIKEDK